ncbi:MAG: LysR family transcriptional regulator [Burkholderiales bacterium]|nr:MAG: LysR family transcriptional regulator [Burkholderiales bacterium]
MDRLRDLEVFVRVVEAGGISRAAEQLDIAKSAVSRRIREIEARLGTQLLLRQGQRLQVTDVGQAFYQRCLRILADLDDAEQEAASAHLELSGTLRIAAPVSFGLMHLAPAMTEFATRHPALTLDVDFSDRRVDLIAGNFDLALRIGELADADLVARPLARIRHVVCASPAYLKREGVPTRPEQLASHAGLHYSPRRDGSVWRYRAPEGSVGYVALPVRLQASSGEFLRDAAIAGMGVILEPTFIVYREIAAGLLVPLLTEWRWPELQLNAVYPRTRHVSRRLRAFIDLLVDRFTDTPYWDRGIAS